MLSVALGSVSWLHCQNISELKYWVRLLLSVKCRAGVQATMAQKIRLV